MFVFAFALVSSCYRDNREDLYKNFDQQNCETDSVSYTSDIDLICITSCAVSGCHLGPNPQSGLDLSNYSDVEAIAKDGRLLNRVNGNGPIMPPSGPLPKCDIDKLEQWVLDGAPNN